MVILFVFGSFAVAQDKKASEGKMDKTTSTDYSQDHESIDSIIKATYDVISGSKEKKRDWNRFEALFPPNARLIPTRKRGDTLNARASTPAEYRKGSEPFFEQNGFFEKEVSRKSEVYGNIAHVFSTYEGRHKFDDEKPFLRGINSFQLLNDGKRWWVVTIFWLAESPDNPLPAKYLNTKD